MKNLPFSSEPRPFIPKEPEETDYGMLGSVGSGLLNLADLPGSMVRDAMSFSNPFDQLASPFSDENRTTGAQISRYWAGGDEDSGGNQLAGMVIDILTDPLMIATGGTAAAGRLGAKAAGSALKGVGKVAGAAKKGYMTRFDTTVPGKMFAKNKPYEEAVSKAAQIEDDLVSKYNDRNTWDPTKGQVNRPFNPSVSQDRRAYQEMLNAERDAARYKLDYTPPDQLRQKTLDAYRADPSLGIRESVMPIAGSARDALGQLGSSVYGGVADSLRYGAGEAMNLVGRGLGVGTGAAKPLRQRDALGQMYAMGTNAMQTATGQRMPQEQSMEDMIAQVLMEDPQLMEELLMAMGVDQSGY